MTSNWLPVTHPNKFFNIYRWNSIIGNYGGFEYKKSSQDNNSIKKPIDLNEIGPITQCDDTKEYTLMKYINGLSNTTIELQNIPLETPYGWSHMENMWLYYTNNNSDKPTHYSTYYMYVD